MKTYNDTFTCNNATINISIIASLKYGIYSLNIILDIFENGVNYSQEALKAYNSSISITLNEKQVVNGSGEHAIYQHIISKLSEFASKAILNDDISFDAQQIFEHFSTKVLNLKSKECISLAAFKLIDGLYLFEHNLQKEDAICSTMLEFALKHGLVYEKAGKLLADKVKLSEIFKISENAAYKATINTTSTSNLLSRLVILTDTIIYNPVSDEANRIMAIINR
ncbi:hypothetical protein [Vibrio sp. Y20_XG_PY13]|uniref:hypothetical protein n=1 Tax=Vibrio sp. Y20_XG_PY13 TaxID=2957761 RepID=UPI0020A59D37|nr:hypothetical protein [Vibrio sp. Y20_XG_PY13]